MGKKIDPKDYIGKKFGRWTVLTVEEPITYQYKWKTSLHRVKCKCECGNENIITLNSLKKGHSTSCGCYNIEYNREIHTKHGYSYTSEYDIWQKMKSRCTNPKDKSYKYYGGRGITVCKEWLESFENFLKDMREKHDINSSIERVNVNGNYEISNCKWIPLSEQAKNTRSNVIITYKNKTQCLTDWARELNIPFSRLRRRIVDNNIPFEEAIKYGKNHSFNPKEQSGELNKMAKLNSEQVIEIFYMKDIQNNIAELYGISRATVGAIKKKLIWKHILKDL